MIFHGPLLPGGAQQQASGAQEVTASVAAAAATSVSMSVVYGVAAQANAVATTTADIVAVQGGTSYSLTATVDGISAASADVSTGPFAPKLLERSGNNADQASYSTGSLTPTAGRLTTVVCYQDDGSATPVTPTPSGTNGWNGTFTQVGRIATGASRAGTMWVIAPVSGTAGAITFDMGGDTQEGCAWEVVEWAGSDYATTVSLANDTAGQNAAGVPASSWTGTLAAFATHSAVYTCICTNGTPTFTEEGGYTVLGTTYTHTTPNANAIGAWKATSDTSPSWSWSASTGYITFAIEIVALTVSASVAATADASATVARAAHRDTQADAVATTTADMVVQSAGGTTYELVAAADAIAAASAAVSTVNAGAASADSAATVSAAISAVYALAAQADATSNATASVASVRAIAADVAATSTADAPMSVRRSLAAQADAVVSTSAEPIAGPQVYTLSAAVDAVSDANAEPDPVEVVETPTETPQASSYRHLQRALRERVSRAVAVTAFRLGTFARARARSIARAVSGLQGIRAVAPTTLATATVEATTGFAFRSASRVTVPVGVTAGGKLAVASGAVVGASAVAVRVGGQRSRTAARTSAPAYATASTRLTLPTARGVTRAGPLHDEDEDELILAMYAMLEAA